MPAFIQDKPIAGYAASARHCSYYPMSGAITSALADDLRGYDTSKGAVRLLTKSIALYCAERGWRVRDGAGRPSLDDIQTHCRTRLAGYKIPRQLVITNSIQRSPSGKADYRWARSVAAAADR